MSGGRVLSSYVFWMGQNGARGAKLCIFVQNMSHRCGCSAANKHQHYVKIASIKTKDISHFVLWDGEIIHDNSFSLKINKRERKAGGVLRARKWSTS